jgi:cysteine synthase
MGVSQTLREVWPALRVAAVEPEESNVMCGKPPGEHGILGIGDGFVPDLVDLRRVDAVLAVSTAEAHRACEEIRERHGFCVGRSSGANTVAARRLRERGSTVATLWPDCSDRYGSLGLEPPSEDSGSCPRRHACAQRARELLRGASPGGPDPC